MGKQGDVEFIWNCDEMEHHEVVSERLRTADRFDCAIAFAKPSGIAHIHKTLKDRLKKKMQARIIVGISMYVTHPDALESILALKDDYGIEAYTCGDGDYTFHPKIYQFTKGNQVSVLIGSANLTHGGFVRNYEASALFNWPAARGATPFDQLMDYLKDGEEITELTQEGIEAYRIDHDIAAYTKSVARRRIKRKAEQDDVPEAPNDKKGFALLLEAVTDLRDDPDNGLDVQANRRRDSYKTAKEVMTRIARAPGLTKNDFIDLYTEMADNWHSGGIHRSKTKIAKTVSRYQELVKVVLQEPKRVDRSRLGEIFKLANTISGAGPNAVSEALHTIDNKAYAVMNQNSSAALRLAGYTGLPQKPSKSNTNLEKYLLFCDEAIELQRKLGLRDLTELDVVSNYLYWRIEAGGDES